MTQRKYVKEFLNATFDQLSLSARYDDVFNSRFHPSNESRTSTDLSQIIKESEDKNAKNVTYLTHVKKCLQALEKIGGPKFVERGTSGRPKKGGEFWKESYIWLWESYYPNWLIEYESKSKERMLADLLLSLNFKKHKDNLEEIIALQPISMFCVDINSTCHIIDKWTYKTLFKKVPGLKKDKPFIVFKKTPEYPASTNWFWDELRRCIGANFTKKELLEELLEICKQESIFIVLTAINNLHPELEIELFNDFFSSLATHPKICDLPFGNCIVVLMVRDRCDRLFSEAIRVNELDDDAKIQTNIRPIMLEPIDFILGKEVNQWLQQKREKLKEIMGDNYQKFAEEVKKWDKTEKIDKSPLKVINNICLKSGLEKGVVEVENFWRIESLNYE